MTKWQQRFMDTARAIGAWSKDPRKKVGCIVVDDDFNQLSGGFNGFPRGVEDTEERLNSKPIKLAMVVHAEANAVAAAARNGHSLKGGIVYVTQPVCSQCAALLIQAGVKKVIALQDPTPQPEHEQSRQLAVQMFIEAYVELDVFSESGELVFSTERTR